MKIRSLLPTVLFSVAVLTAAPAARAVTIASYTDIYAAWAFEPQTYAFNYGINENQPPAVFDSWDSTLLTISSFTNAVWGSTYTFNAGNTASFLAFTAMLTDAEEDWLGHSLVTSSGAGFAYYTEAWKIFGAPIGPFGADLAGHNISEITIHFEEDHFFDEFNPDIQGKYTVTFSGSVANTPDSVSTLALLVATFGGAYVMRPRRRASA